MLHTAANHCTLYLKQGYINLKIDHGKTRVYVLDINMEEMKTKLTVSKEEMDWCNALSYIVLFLRK